MATRKTRLTYPEAAFALIGLAAFGYAIYAFYAEYQLSGGVSPLAIVVLMIAGVLGMITWRHAKKRRATEK